jgi:hypothetical protein
VAAPAVLGVPAMRPAFLDNVRVGARSAQGGGAATGHAGRDNAGPDRTKAGGKRPAQPLTPPIDPKELV